MTLILGMSKPEGIYLSVDYRVTNPQTHELVDDATVKFLTVHYPPDETGPKVLMAYTGVAFTQGGTPIGDWLRETLRGETEVIDTNMRHLETRLNRDLSYWLYRHQAPLIVNVLVVEGERRLFGGFTNLHTSGAVTRKFEYFMHELAEPCVLGNGSGAARVVADGHFAKLREQVNVRPRQPDDHMKLLAIVNRRVAAVEPSVSPHCYVSFINADDSFGPTSRVFVEHGESVPFSMPMIVSGIDLSYMAEKFVRESAPFFEAARRGEEVGGMPLPRTDVDPDEVNKHLKRRP